MHYSVNPVLFYVSVTRTPTGVVVTDNKNYYIMLIPNLFPKNPPAQKHTAQCLFG